MRRSLILSAGFLLGLAGLWLFGPREGVDRSIGFDPSVLGDDPEVWLSVSEQRFADLRPGAAKRILWAGAKGAKTPLAVVYLHGFTATAEEIRPVPDEVARDLGANLYFARLAGHGRAPEAMGEASAGDWIEDLAEAMAVGRSIGERVLLIGTSTGATLAAIAATDPELSRDLEGVVMISPNFALKSRWGLLLDMPFLRVAAPLILGRSVTIPAVNADHARYWTTEFPSAALVPLAALMREARAADYSRASAPLLVLLSPGDRVIDPEAVGPVLSEWAGPAELIEFRMQAGDDPWSHVIAGDVFSPGQTERVIDSITAWIRAR